MIKNAISPILGVIFLGLMLTLTPHYAAAADEASTGSSGPLGSHADMRSQFSNARHLWQSGKLKEAARLYESIISHHPDLPAPYNNLAVIYAAQGDYKKAQLVLEKGLNTDPGYAMIYENLTAIYVEMARDSYGKALQFVDKSDHQLKLRSLAELSLKPSEQVSRLELPPNTTVVAAASSPVTRPKVAAEPQAAVVPKVLTALPQPATAETATKSAVPEATTIATRSAVPEVAAPATKAPTPVAPLAEAQGPEQSTTSSAPVLMATTSVQPAQMMGSTPEIDKTSIEKILEAWATAWSTQSPAQYLAFYDPQFHPAGMSRQQWEAQRVKRLKRPQWIRVVLSNFVIEPINSHRVRVEVQQRYQSNTYSDNERKEIILTQTEQGWRIVSERSL